MWTRIIGKRNYYLDDFKIIPKKCLFRGHDLWNEKMFTFELEATLYIFPCETRWKSLKMFNKSVYINYVWEGLR